MMDVEIMRMLTRWANATNTALKELNARVAALEAEINQLKGESK